MTQAPWTRAFLSYARADAFLLDKRLSLLATRGVAVLRDTSDILPSEAWRARIVALIGEADSMVCVLSPRFADSEVCAWEVQTARSLNKRLIPVLLEPVGTAPLTGDLGALNWLPWDSGLPDVDAVEALHDVLALDITWVREHTRLATLAAHWESSSRSEAGLLRGPALAAAEEWLVSYPPSAPASTPLHQQFITASRAADLSRRRRMLWVASAVAVVATALAIGAGVSYLEAQHNLRVAESRRYAMLSTQALSEGYPQRAALLAGHALGVPRSHDGPVMDAVNAARQVLAAVSGRAWLTVPGTVTAMSQARAGRVAVASARFESGIVQAVVTVAEDAVAGTARSICAIDLGEEVVTTVALSLDGALMGAVTDRRVLQFRIDAKRCVKTIDRLHGSGRSRWVVFDPQGQWVVLPGSVVEDITLVPLVGKAAPRSLGRMAGGVGAIAVSADGQWLAAASDFDGRGAASPGEPLAKLWQLDGLREPRGRVLMRLGAGANAAPAAALAVSAGPAGPLVLIGRDDGTVTHVQVAAGQLGGKAPTLRSGWITLQTLGRPGDAAVSAITAAADGRFWVGRVSGQVSPVAYAPGRGPLAEGQRTSVSTRDIVRITAWQDGRGLAVAARDGAGWAPDLSWCGLSGTGAVSTCRALRGHEGGMVDVTPASEGALLLSASQDSTVRAWQATAGFSALAGSQWLGPSGGKLEQSSDGQRWFVAGGDGSRGDSVAFSAGNVSGSEAGARTLAVSQDGRWRLIADSGAVFREELAGAGAREPLPLPTPTVRDLVALGRDGRQVAVHHAETGALWVWQPGGRVPRSTALAVPGPSHLAWSPSGNRLAIAYQPGDVLLWADPFDADTIPQALSGGPSDHRGIAWHPDGRTLATAGFEATLTLWDTDCAVGPGGCGPLRLAVDSQLRAPAFSPDGRWLACGATSGAIHLWQVSRRRLVTPARVLRGHDGDVAAVAFSRDSTLLASASFSWTSGDSSLRVWNLAIDNPARGVDEVIRGDDWYSDVRIDVEARSVVGLTKDGEVRSFPLQAPALAAVLRQFAARGFSAFEQGRYLDEEY